MNRRKNTPSRLPNNSRNTPVRGRINPNARPQQTHKKFPILPLTFFTRKRIFTLVAGFLVLLVIFAFLTQGSASLKVYADVQDKQVSTTQDITANFGATDGIQAFTKSQTETGSDSNPTTGTGKVGTPATGSVRATYLQAAGTITIKAGTTMTCSNPSDCNNLPLNFVTLEDQTFSLATSPVNINLKAADIGGDYNLKTGIKFKVQGIAESDISLTNVSPFTGGSSRDTRVVAQSDVDDLKARLTETLKSNAYSKITSAAGPNATILPDKVKVDIKSVKTDKNVGDEAENVSMDMEVNITASGYDKTTVAPYVQNLLQKEEKDNLKLDLSTIDIQQNVKSADDKSIVITIVAKGTLKPDINKDDVIKSIKGKSLDSIKGTVEKIPNVSNVTYIYSAGWLPGFMKHVPDNAANINLELKEK